MKIAGQVKAPRGVTLVELVIVVGVMGILLSAALPSYRSHMLRVHRNEGIRLLLQASMCQQRIRSVDGLYDTSRCFPASAPRHYRIVYAPSQTQASTFRASAVPQGAQRADHCGKLTLDQNGTRGIGGPDEDAVKCWSGR